MYLSSLSHLDTHRSTSWWEFYHSKSNGVY